MQIPGVKATFWGVPSGPLLRGTRLLFWIYALYTWVQKSSGGPGSGAQSRSYDYKVLMCGLAVFWSRLGSNAAPLSYDNAMRRLSLR